MSKEIEDLWDLVDETLRDVMKRDGKDAMEQLAKLMEECGELAQAMLCVHGAKTSLHRGLTKSHIKEELADILLCVKTLALTHGISTKELETFSGVKLYKWHEKLDEQERKAWEKV